MKNLMHAILGTTALLLILSFFTTSILVELSGRTDWILGAKRYIAYALIFAIPCMISTAGMGRSLAANRQSPLIQKKQARMRFIAANGMLVLTPLAIILYQLALRGSFGPLFTVLQLVEILAGATNIYLLTLMMRDGFNLSGRFARRQVPKTE
ncbi:hypothetical protein [Vitiosangium sp. GDMCC 1.1324]|uniref:hypothetical protein n=1 Tax=Vitiosangium sp. (strain GDMCC 1.1324) TaxID=2138576 RepID=UPI00130DFD8A|nr:hypothetical protein [Vitiosangium sp. GDMCC 1.1324]